MKSNIFNILGAGCLMFAITSCDGAWTPPSPAEGELALGAMDVKNDDAVKLIENDMSRASSDAEIQNYKVSISKKGENTPVYTYTYGEMPEVVTLNVGEYTVSVKSHDVQKAEWDKPYFIGSRDFSITSGKITEVEEIVCKFSSIKVTITYSDELKSMLTEATVNVKANDLGVLDFTLGETRAGYFEALEGSTTMIVTFNGVLNGTAITKSVNLTNVAAGQHRIINFGAKTIPPVPEQTGTVDPGGITVDADMIIEDIDGNQTVEEDIIGDVKNPWDPGTGEDPNPPTPPTPGEEAAKFESTTINLDGVNDPTKYSGDPETAVVSISCPEGFANLKVKIATDNANFEASVSEMLPMEFDLAYPGDQADNLASLEFPVGDAVIGQKSLDFDISMFVPLLGSFPGTHTFTITVVDSKGSESSKTLTFKN